MAAWKLRATLLEWIVEPTLVVGVGKAAVGLEVQVWLALQVVLAFDHVRGRR